MPNGSPFHGAQHYTPAETLEYRGALLPARFAGLGDEYRAVRDGAGLFDRSDRGLLVLTGTDGKSWLGNLVTNVVGTLDDYAGNYAFALDVKGRIQFDLNILCVPDALWLDIDRVAIPAAIAHLDRYLIAEDAQIHERSAAYARLGCSGTRAADVAAQLGVTNFAALPALASVALGDAPALLVRHDFTGLPGFELIVDSQAATAWWDRVAEAGARPAGFLTLDVLRIEAGIPWLGNDIDDRVLPPETGQIERAISHQKGCYLGQEVVERMRSHCVLARRLVRLRAEPGPPLALPADLTKDGSTVGRITSLMAHPIAPIRVGLGYLKTSATDLTGLAAGDPPQAITVR